MPLMPIYRLSLWVFLWVIQMLLIFQEGQDRGLKIKKFIIFAEKIKFCILVLSMRGSVG